MRKRVVPRIFMLVEATYLKVGERLLLQSQDEVTVSSANGKAVVDDSREYRAAARSNMP
jgi:hypothetical protein